MTIDDIMAMAPVIPVLSVHDVLDAKPIAQALLSGGLMVIEVTLRTPAALDVISEMAAVDGVVVGAGTVVNSEQLGDAISAGARFIVSPGLTGTLGRAARERSIPFLPGIANAGDIMRGLELGLTRFKFFPAEASGGRAALAALAAPFAQCRFCPTGGITRATAGEWLKIPAVSCVGGSWLVPPGPPEPGLIRDAAASAASLRA